MSRRWASVSFLAWFTYRSYSSTGNWRLLFVAVAFLVFLLKAVLFTWNELTHPHPIDHDLVLVVVSIFDLIIMVLILVPFLARGR
jgi:hypothetical protein